MEVPRVVTIVRINGVRGGSRLRYRLGIIGDARAITTAKSKWLSERRWEIKNRFNLTPENGDAAGEEGSPP
jgi:hypothetical protein